MTGWAVAEAVFLVLPLLLLWRHAAAVWRHALRSAWPYYSYLLLLLPVLLVQLACAVVHVLYCTVPFCVCGGDGRR